MIQIRGKEIPQPNPQLSLKTSGHPINIGNNNDAILLTMSVRAEHGAALSIKFYDESLASLSGFNTIYTIFCIISVCDSVPSPHLNYRRIHFCEGANIQRRLKRTQFYIIQLYNTLHEIQQNN